MIPLELKNKRNWVGWLSPGKIPMNPATGFAAASDNIETWSTFSEAERAVKDRKWAGVGFMLGNGYIGIDLDDCVVNEEINEYAQDILKRCNSYAEFSPSKTGIHIICKGIIPKAIKTATLEVYNEKRYFTMTGDTIKPYSIVKNVNLDWLFSGINNVTSVRPFLDRLNELQEGNRNNTFTSLAGSLRAKGFSPEVIYELLISKAKEVGFPEKELETICRSVGRYPIDNSRFESSDNLEQSSSIEAFLSDIQKVEWIVPDLIAQRSIGFVAGLPESRKTWILIDLAIEVARGGGLWLGKFPVRQGKVLFVDQERFKGETQRRFKNVISAKDLELKMICQSLFIRCGTTTRLNLQHSFDAFRKELSELQPNLVIVDSFATIHSNDENNRQSIQDVLERIKQLRNEFGCTFIFISHENKFAFASGEDAKEPSIAEMAGSVAIPAAAEFVFTVRKHDAESSFVYNTKNTLAQNAAPFMVKVIDTDDTKTKIKVEAF